MVTKLLYLKKMLMSALKAAPERLPIEFPPGFPPNQNNPKTAGSSNPGGFFYNLSQ